MAQDQLLDSRGPITRIIPPLIILSLLSIAAVLLIQSGDFSSPLPIYASIAIFIYILTLFDIRIGLVVTLAAISFSPEFRAGGVDDLRVEDFLIPVLLFSFLTKKEKSNPTNLRGPIFLYLGISLLSASFAILMAKVSPSRSLLITFKFAEYFTLLYLVANIVRTREEIKFVTYLFICIALVVALQSMFMPVNPGTDRVAGPEGETANIFAGYLTMFIALCIGLFMETTQMRTRVLLISAAFVLFYVTLVTYSRTGYVALFASLALFGLIKRRKVLLMLVMVSITFTVVAPESVWYRAGTILGVLGDNAPSSYQARVNAWETSASKDFLQSPLIGHGPGYRPFGWLDNEYFRVLVDLGLIGLGAFLWLLFRLLYMGNKAYNQSSPMTFERGLCGGYMLALISMMVHAWGATSFTSIRTMETFMVISGLMVAQWNLMREKEKEEKEEDRYGTPPQPKRPAFAPMGPKF